MTIISHKIFAMHCIYEDIALAVVGLHRNICFVGCAHVCELPPINCKSRFLVLVIANAHKIPQTPPIKNDNPIF
jgi:hypothetical protein